MCLHISPKKGRGEKRIDENKKEIASVADKHKLLDHYYLDG